MEIILIIVGSILFVINGLLCLSSSIATKNQENWDDFFRQVSESGNPIPEEEAYNLVCRVKGTTTIFTILGIIIVLLGIVLIIIK